MANKDFNLPPEAPNIGGGTHSNTAEFQNFELVYHSSANDLSATLAAEFSVSGFVNRSVFVFFTPEDKFISTAHTDVPETSQNVTFFYQEFAEEISANLSSDFSLTSPVNDHFLNVPYTEERFGPAVLNQSASSPTDYDLNYHPSTYDQRETVQADFYSQFILTVNLNRTVVELDSDLDSTFAVTSDIETVVNLSTDLTADFSASSEVEQVKVLQSTLIGQFSTTTVLDADNVLEADLLTQFVVDCTLNEERELSASLSTNFSVSPNVETFIKFSASLNPYTTVQANFRIKKALPANLSSKFTLTAKVDPLIAVRMSSNTFLRAAFDSLAIESRMVSRFLLRSGLDYADKITEIYRLEDDEFYVTDPHTLVKKPYNYYERDVFDVDARTVLNPHDETVPDVFNGIDDHWVTYYPNYYTLPPIAGPVLNTGADPQALVLPGHIQEHASSQIANVEDLKDDLRVSIGLRNYVERSDLGRQILVSKGADFIVGVEDHVLFLEMSTANGLQRYECVYTSYKPELELIPEPRVGRPAWGKTHDPDLIVLDQYELNRLTIIRDTVARTVSFISSIDGILTTFENADNSALLNNENEVKIGEGFKGIITDVSIGNRGYTLTHVPFGSRKHFTPLKKDGTDTRGNEWRITRDNDRLSANILDRTVWGFDGESWFDLDIVEYNSIDFSDLYPFTVLLKGATTSEDKIMAIAANGEIDIEGSQGHGVQRAGGAQAFTWMAQNQETLFRVYYNDYQPLISFLGENVPENPYDPQNGFPLPDMASHEWLTVGYRRSIETFLTSIVLRNVMRSEFAGTGDVSTDYPYRIGASQPSSRINVLAYDGGSSRDGLFYLPFEREFDGAGAVDEFGLEQDDFLLDGGDAYTGDSQAFFESRRDGGNVFGTFVGEYDSGDANTAALVTLDGGIARHVFNDIQFDNPFYGYIQSFAITGHEIGDNLIGEHSDWGGKIGGEPSWLRDKAYVYRHAGRAARGEGVDHELEKIIPKPANNGALFGDVGANFTIYYKNKQNIFHEERRWGKPSLVLQDVINFTGIDTSKVSDRLKILIDAIEILPIGQDHTEFGTPILEDKLVVRPSGFESTSFGDNAVTTPIYVSSFVTGIVSVPTVGYDQDVTVPSISDDSAMGDVSVTMKIKTSTIVSQTSFGIAQVNTDGSIGATSVDDGNLFGLPSLDEGEPYMTVQGFTSEEFGIPTLTSGSITITMEAVSTDAVFGTPNFTIQGSAIKIYRNDEFQSAPLRMWTGSQWVSPTVRRWTGSQWIEL